MLTFPEQTSRLGYFDINVQIVRKVLPSPYLFFHFSKPKRVHSSDVKVLFRIFKYFLRLFIAAFCDALRFLRMFGTPPNSFPSIKTRLHKIDLRILRLWETQHTRIQPEKKDIYSFFVRMLFGKNFFLWQPFGEYNKTNLRWFMTKKFIIWINLIWFLEFEIRVASY